MVSILIAYKKNEISPYYVDAIKEYSKRLQRYCSLTLQEVSSSQELTPLLSSYYTFSVHHKGQSLDSVSFSKKLQSLTLQGHSKVAFLLNMKLDADDSLRLTTLDLSDDLSIVCMLEQLYRAFRIWYGEPYHK